MTVSSKEGHDLWLLGMEAPLGELPGEMGLLHTNARPLCFVSLRMKKGLPLGEDGCFT